MEVKIKTNNEMVDATIEMVDGVMVVSPIEKFVPKDGDVICVNASYQHIAIFKDVVNGCIISYADYNINLNGCTNGTFVVCRTTDILSIRLATEVEKKLLFDRIDEEGYEWLADEKKFVKKKWIPNTKEYYYKINLERAEIVPLKTCWSDDWLDNAYYDKGWVFRTKEECQKLCDRLNEAINSVKP